MDFEHLFASRASRMKASEIRELLKLLDQPDIISFAGGIPDPDLFPDAAFDAAYQKIFTTNLKQTALQYSVSEGYAPLREWLCEYMRKLGVACSKDNILITSGSQQALNYLGKLFLSPNDTALLQWPTYLGALGAFNAYEPAFDEFKIASNREMSSYGEKAAAAGGNVKFAYMSVDFANPTGYTMSEYEREQALDFAEQLDIAIIEDAAYQGLRYEGEHIPPILALELKRNPDINAARTIYCGSFSKTLAPGLRMGWVCASEEVVSKLVLMKQASDLHSSTINQIAVTEVVAEGFYDHVETLRTTYRTRRDAMIKALETYMPKDVSWKTPEGGMFLWLTLPEGTCGVELLATSLKTQKLAFVPGSAFFPDRSGKNTIRLSFSTSSVATIDEGISRLGRLLRENAG